MLLLYNGSRSNNERVKLDRFMMQSYDGTCICKFASHQRQQLQLLDDESTGYTSDLRRRAAYSDLPLRPNGAPLIEVNYERVLQNSVTAWHKVSYEAHASAWVACGYFENGFFNEISHRTFRICSCRSNQVVQNELGKIIAHRKNPHTLSINLVSRLRIL